MNYRLVFNFAVSIIVAFVLFVLMLISVFSNIEKRKTAYFFLWSIVSAIIPIGLSVLWYGLRVSNDTPLIIVKIVGTLVYITMFAASYAF